MRDKAYNSACQILVDMCERKRNSLDKLRKRLQRYTTKNNTNPNYFQTIDMTLYKEMFNALRKYIRQQFNKKGGADDIINNRNGIWIYKDKGIITLNFPNTEFEKYKTAAIIIDKDDIKKVDLNSNKKCWTYKHSNKAPKQEYDKKTMKPDKVTNNGAKVNLAQLIYGGSVDDKGEKTYYIQQAHKFDFRRKNISITHQLKRKKDDRYYQGKLRIDNDECVDSKTVCLNNEENRTDAAILYFDDMDRFANFLDNM